MFSIGHLQHPYQFGDVFVGSLEAVLLVGLAEFFIQLLDKEIDQFPYLFIEDLKITDNHFPVDPLENVILVIIGLVEQESSDFEIGKEEITDAAIGYKPWVVQHLHEMDHQLFICLVTMLIQLLLLLHLLHQLNETNNKCDYFNRSHLLLTHHS